MLLLAWENFLDGGVGNDTINIAANATASGGDYSEATIDTRADGGSGDDVLSATAEATGGDLAVAYNSLYGDSGDDSLTASARATVAEEGGDAFAANYLDGGSAKTSCRGRRLQPTPWRVG